MNNENTWTQGKEHHILGVTGGARGGITWGEMPDIVKGGIEAANHLVIYAPNATHLHDLHMYPRT